MKYGVNTFIWTAQFDSSSLPLLPAIKEHGFDGIEIPVFRPSTFEAAPIRRGAEAIGLEVNTCTVMVDGMSLIHADPEIRRRTQAHLRDCIRATADAGGHLLAGPLYSPVGYLPGRRRTADEWAWAIEGFQSLGEVLIENHITLAIEPLNRFETYFLNTAADAVALCDCIDHPRIGVLFDTFHANIEEKDIAAAYRSLGHYLKHVHLCENDRGTPGSGHIDWPGVFGALRDLKYDGWLTIESFGFALGEISAAASIWRDIEMSPESIAWDGIGFLKAGVQSSH